MLFHFVDDDAHALLPSMIKSTLQRWLQTSAVTLGFFNVFAATRVQRVVIATQTNVRRDLFVRRWNMQRSRVSTAQKKFEKNNALIAQNGRSMSC
ncbi:hypothetical protein RE6C_01554 [Rhodopirellula europaea 6C]|uniref:Uncharacterized protein n=1 Tax=Rhodopirellula europaea 6C TaxID=1263867 RepID=M2AYA6_9BACT|nr:hypothetical protein RE6C_01554 [Rhodopirellula europaea 6C]